MDIYIKGIRAIGGGLVVELDVMENKISIMRRRGMLNGIDIWIDNDLMKR